MVIHMITEQEIVKELAICATAKDIDECFITIAGRITKESHNAREEDRLAIFLRGAASLARFLAPG